VLVVEAMGQLAFTLIHFACGQRLDVPHDVAPPRARAVHIHGATFIEPFTPGDTMTLHAQVVERDATMLIVGQAWKNDTLAAFAVLEMYVAARTGRGQPRPHRHTATRHAEQLPRRTCGGPLGHLALEGFLD
jgi:hypothetical protein